METPVSIQTGGFYVRLRLGLFIVALLAFGGVLSAGPLTWQFTNIVFDDGTLVTGSFVFDADTTTFSGLNMTTSGGISVPATNSWVFNINNPIAEQNAGGITGFEAVDALSGDETGAHLISLFSTLGPLMTDAGGTITLNFFVAGTCLDATCANYNSDDRHSVSGQGEFTSETSTPEPSTLILGGSALILAGLRRKLFARA
jgi:hypothetical protein